MPPPTPPSTSPVPGTSGWSRVPGGRWAPVLALAAAIWVGAILPGDTVSAPGRLDLVAHAVEFIVFAAAATWAGGPHARGWVALAFSLGLGVLTEASQRLVPTRQADPADLVADLLGAALGIALWRTFRWTRGRSTSTPPSDRDPQAREASRS